MSLKNKDSMGRWRSKTIAFRVSPAENEQINNIVKLTGLSKQEYMTSNMLRHSITVYPTPRVHKALREYFIAVAEHLKDIKYSSELSAEFMDVLNVALQIYEKMGSSK